MSSYSPPAFFKKKYGFPVFVASCIFSATCIGFVLWDEHSQKERRQEGVKYRLKSIQQQQNMEEYELQKQAYNEYKAKNS